MSSLAGFGTRVSKDVRTSEENARSPQKSATFNDRNYYTVREGLAEILIPPCVSKTSNERGDGTSKSTNKDDSARQAVFYNPIQQYNRDLSVLAIKAFADDLAAVRLAKQEQKEKISREGESRGKKRKKQTDHKTSKKSKADEEGEPFPANKSDGNEQSAEEVYKFLESIDNDDDFVLVSGGEEARNSKELKEDTHEGCKSRELGSSDNSRDRNIGTTPQCTEVKNPDPLKGPPKKTSNNSAHPFRVLDALSASGLRALRYAKEIPAVTSITANDLSPKAIASIKMNIAHNALAPKVTATTGNAIEHMHSTMSRVDGRVPQSYHVIDLDPYGTAAPFLDAAVQAVTDGGLLCATCTDAGVFASVGYLEKTCSQYGGLPVKGPHAHEAGLRLILHAIATSAARYGIAIEPLLSLSIDFYARVFVRVHKSPAEVKFLASKTMLVYQCDAGCGSWSTQFLAQAKSTENRNGETIYKFTSALGPSAGKECEHCGFKTHLAGPMWGGALHNPFFVQRILDMLPDLDREVYQTIPRIEGMLSLALEEDLDDPWASTGNSKDKSSTGDMPAYEASEHSEANAATSVIDGATSKHDPISTDSCTRRPIPPLPAPYRTHHPFFIHPPSLARTLNAPTPSDASLRGALRHLGYLTSRSHTKPGSIVTNAPFTVIWEIMREWVRRGRERNGKASNSSDKPNHQSSVNPNTAAAGILKHDRSNSALLSLRQELMERIAQAASVQDLTRELQAALFRLDRSPPANVETAAAVKETAPAPQQRQPQEEQDQQHNLSIPPQNQPNSPNLPIPSFTPTKPTTLSALHTLDIKFGEQLGKDSPRTLTSTAAATATSSHKTGQEKKHGNEEKEGNNGREKNKKRMVRYQENPRENWGPLTKAQR